VATPGNKWRHVIIKTRSSWLHGDERGFRDRGHRIHSSGDYKHGPPKGVGNRARAGRFVQTDSFELFSEPAEEAWFDNRRWR
jgi:hypothetical protein